MSSSQKPEAANTTGSVEPKMCYCGFPAVCHLSRRGCDPEYLCEEHAPEYIRQNRAKAYLAMERGVIKRRLKQKRV